MHLPPALVRAIVAAMRRRSEQRVACERIHQLRMLSACWTAQIDDDARRRNFAIQAEILSVPAVGYFLKTMPVERRRRTLITVLAPPPVWSRADQNNVDALLRPVAAALRCALHVCIRDKSPYSETSLNRMIDSLPRETRTLDLSLPLNSNTPYRFSSSTHIVALPNLRNLVLRGREIINIESFIHPVARASFQHLRYIDLRGCGVASARSISAIVNAVPSLHRLDLRSTIPRDRRAKVREELCATLLERAEKVIL